MNKRVYCNRRIAMFFLSDNMKLYGCDHIHKYPRPDVKSSFERVHYLNLNSWHIPGQLF